MLIGYLAASNLLDGAEFPADLTAAAGWNYLLDRICDREINQIPGASIEAATLRTVLERLATIARTLDNGRGPLTADTMFSIYESVFGQPADGRTQTLLLRLPGISVSPGQEGAREFIDDDLVDACRTGDMIRFIDHPHDNTSWFSGIEVSCGSVALEGISAHLTAVSQKQVVVAAQWAADNKIDLVASDIIRSSMLSNLSSEMLNIVIRDIYIQEIDVYSDTNFRGVMFQDCLFDRLNLLADGDIVKAENLPTFRNCLVGGLGGVKGPADLPQTKFDSTNTIDSYIGLGVTNAEILNSHISLAVGVLLTIIKKTFVQSGGGRQEAALYRGLDNRAKSYVPDVLELMQRFGFLRQSKRAGPTVWTSEKSKLAAALRIREAPMTSDDPLIKSVRLL